MAELQPKKFAAQWMIVGESRVTQAGGLDALARSLGRLKPGLED
jgi:hypothetical protein